MDANQSQLLYFKRGENRARQEMMMQQQDSNNSLIDKLTRQQEQLQRWQEREARKARKEAERADLQKAADQTDRENELGMAQIKQTFDWQEFIEAQRKFTEAQDHYRQVIDNAQKVKNQPDKFNADLIFDSDKLAQAKFPNYEYKNYQGITNAPNEKRIADIESKSPHLNPTVVNFPKMSHQPQKVLDRLNHNGQVLLNVPSLAHKWQSKLEDQIDEPNCFQHLPQAMRQKVNFLEHYNNRQNVDLKMAQDAITDPQAWAYAVSEVRTKTFLNTRKNQAGQPVADNVPMIYRYFAIQEAFSKGTHDWTKYLEKADHELAGELGGEAVFTGKAITSDYLTYLNQHPNNESVWDKANKQIAKYPNHGLLNQKPLKIDPYQQKRQAYLKLKAQVGVTDPDKLEKLVNNAQDDYYASALDLHNKALRLSKDNQYIKTLSDENSDWHNFNKNWQKDKNNVEYKQTDLDIGKLLVNTDSIISPETDSELELG